MVALPLVVPLAAVPSQTLNITLGGQPCRIKLFTKNLQVPALDPGEIVTEPPRFVEIDPIFMELYLNDVLLLGGVLCLNEVRIVRDAYLKFIGDLSFQDLQGSDDPRVAGLGTRWILCYWPDLI
jgi:hypothetical protein